MPAASIPDHIVAGQVDTDTGPDLFWDIAARNGTSFEIAYARKVDGDNLEALSPSQAVDVERPRHRRSQWRRARRHRRADRDRRRDRSDGREDSRAGAEYRRDVYAVRLARVRLLCDRSALGIGCGHAPPTSSETGTSHATRLAHRRCARDAPAALDDDLPRLASAVDRDVPERSRRCSPQPSTDCAAVAAQARRDRRTTTPTCIAANAKVLHAGHEKIQALKAALEPHQADARCRGADDRRVADDEDVLERSGVREGDRSPVGRAVKTRSSSSLLMPVLARSRRPDPLNRRLPAPPRTAGSASPAAPPIVAPHPAAGRCLPPHRRSRKPSRRSIIRIAGTNRGTAAGDRQARRDRTRPPSARGSRSR